MAGLIWSQRYIDAKSRMCGERQRTADAIEALEWRLLDMKDPTEFPEVPEENQKGSPIRSIVISPTEHTPGVVAVFAMETFDGTDKALLIDVRFSEEDDE
jgi:hypothetical protein